jgi:uncharacterized protein
VHLSLASARRHAAFRARFAHVIHLVLAAAAFIAGLINAVAGGGSLVSFPALLLAGMPSVTANATNTLAVWPGTVSSTWAYRGVIATERRRAVTLAVPSLLGGLAGSIILLNTPEKAFRAVVPWLILFACALLMAQTRVAAWLLRRRGAAPEARVPAALWVVQFIVSVYGGYFGAGLGILMLAAMGIFLPDALDRANGLKVLFGGLINGIAALYFVAVGAVRLPEAALMSVCALAGGWVGAHVAQRLPARVFRAVVVTYGVVVALKLLLDNR